MGCPPVLSGKKNHSIARVRCEAHKREGCVESGLPRSQLKRRSGLLLLRRSSRSVTSSPRFLAARDCGLDHPGSMSLALKTGAAGGAVRNLISDLAASAFLLALDTLAMKTRYDCKLGG